MTRYLLSVHSDRDPRPEPSNEAEMRASWERIMAVEEELRAAGVFKFGGRLEDPANAHVARPVKHRVRMSDGPYAETKEMLGGFYLIDADDEAAALSWASKVAIAVDRPIEIRAFAAVSSD
jgi:hypothetical protein